MRQGKWVIIKQNAAEILEKKLEGWYKKKIQISLNYLHGSVTDPINQLNLKNILTPVVRVWLPIDRH